jgi:hypothetical protein
MPLRGPSHPQPRICTQPHTVYEDMLCVAWEGLMRANSTVVQAGYHVHGLRPLLNTAQGLVEQAHNGGWWVGPWW